MLGIGERKSANTAVYVASAIGILAIGLGAMALAKNPRLLKRLGWGTGEDNMINETSEESFPASDAPSWTPTTSLGSLH
jgi:hypothetical protein